MSTPCSLQPGEKSLGNDAMRLNTSHLTMASLPSDHRALSKGSHRTGPDFLEVGRKNRVMEKSTYNLDRSRRTSEYLMKIDGRSLLWINAEEYTEEETPRMEIQIHLTLMIKVELT